MLSPDSIITLTYRLRWPLAAALLLSIVLLFGSGISQMTAFSTQVDQLKEEVPDEPAPPRVFDARFDIWFDQEDAGLRTYNEIEDRFVAEDTVLVAIEETEDPMGVFGIKALESVARMTAKIEQVPYVRNVRSLTSNPWIRWGQAAQGEEGLIVSDLFEDEIRSYSSEDRIDRMIAVLGAERAAAIVGESAVRGRLGTDANFADHIGEPRLIDSIISPDGRTTAIQVQVLRTRVPEERLDNVFGPETSVQRAVGPAIITNESQWSALEQVEQIAADEAYDVHIAGMPLLERNFMQVGMADGKYVGLMFALIALILILVFRRAVGVSVPLLVVFASIMGMEGLVWLKGDLINNLTAIAPNMITAVGIADAVHLVTMYLLLRPQFDDRHALVEEVLRRNWLPVFLTSITTAVGFFSLMTSEIVPMRMLGYTGGIGTLFAYALSITVVPALLSLIPVNGKSADANHNSIDDHDGNHWSDVISSFVVRNRATVLAAVALVTGLSIYGLARVEVSSDFRKMFPDDNQLVMDINWIESRLGGTGDLEIVFFGPDAVEDEKSVADRQERIEALLIQESTDEGSALSAAEQDELVVLQAAEDEYKARRVAASHEFLAQVDAFARQVEQERVDPSSPLHVLTSFDSALSVLRKIHQVQNENLADYYRIPTIDDVPQAARTAQVEYDDILEEAVFIPSQDASTMASQYYLQFENGAKPTENLGPLITADRRGFRIAARVTSAPATQHLAAYDRLREIVAQDFPGLASVGDAPPGDAMSTMTLTGKHFLFTNMVQKFSYTLITSLSLAIFIITLLIILIFRSLSIGVLSLIPNVLPLLLPLGFMGLIGLPIDGPAVIVCAIALGVCVDGCIHFLTKFTKAHQKGLSTMGALRHAFRQVGAALTWTTIILMIGFAVLTLSDFRPNMMIGYLGVTMIGLAWVADFLILPALLTYLVADESPS